MNSFERASTLSRKGMQDEAAKIAQMLGVSLPSDGKTVKERESNYNPRVTIDTIIEFILSKGMKISKQFIKRYHLSLINKGFVILSGISGTGKTWLTELYAEAIGAEYKIVPVAPNWTSNEDLLGFFNPLDNQYKHTPFSQFLMEAQKEYETALDDNRIPKPYHIILDEMNLARVEYYFAKFLSLMEVRSRNKDAMIEIPPNDKLILTPNLFFIGTINVDETTHGFADKVYDRAQLLEVEINRTDIVDALDDLPYKDIVLEIWDAIYEIAPFAYRVLGDMKKYIDDSEQIGTEWREALDEQVLQKILPKLKGTDIEVGTKLETLREILESANLSLSLRKVEKMLERYSNYGVVSYF